MTSFFQSALRVMRTRCSSWRLGSEMTVAEELVKPEEQLELSEEV
jgi:hypothetical protein